MLTPLQNSNDTFEEEQGLRGAEDQMWSAKERTIIARTKQFLERSLVAKMEVEELEDLLDRILKVARDERGCEIFETFSTDGLSEFLVASRSRWGRVQKKVERTMETKFVGERQRVGWSSMVTSCRRC